MQIGRLFVPERSPECVVSRPEDEHPGLSSHVSLQSFRPVAPGVRMRAATLSR